MTAIAAVVLNPYIRPKAGKAVAHDVKVIAYLYFVVHQELVFIFAFQNLAFPARPDFVIVLQPFPHLKREDPPVVDRVRGLTAAGLARVDPYRVPEIELTIPGVCEHKICIEFAAIINVEHNDYQLYCERIIYLFGKARNEFYN